MIADHESDYDDDNVHLRRRGDGLYVELTYPGLVGRDGNKGVKFVHLNQESVRGSDGIRLSYDYERDGWRIEQPCDEIGTFRETAYVESWALCEPFSDEEDPSPDEPPQSVDDALFWSIYDGIASKFGDGEIRKAVLGNTSNNSTIREVLKGLEQRGFEIVRKERPNG